MEINKSPILTSVNYGINNIDFPQSEIKYSHGKFNSFTTCGTENCSIKTNYGILAPEFLVKQNQNFCTSIVIKKTQDEPIILNFDLDKNNSVLIDYLSIKVENFVNAKVIIKYKSNADVYHNSLININATENSNLDVLVINDLGKNSTNLIKFNNLVQENGKLYYKIIDFCSNYTIHNFNSKIEENSLCELKSIYIGGENCLIDLNYTQNLLEQNSCCSIDCVGAISGNATKNFKGTIDFKKGATKSKGYENEMCLLLSNTAKSKALPMLLCGEEDVDGTHSSSVGKIGDKELFYLMSRGIDRNEAIRIFVKAKFNIVLKDLDEQTMKEILDRIDKELDNER